MMDFRPLPIAAALLLATSGIAGAALEVPAPKNLPALPALAGAVLGDAAIACAPAGAPECQLTEEEEALLAASLLVDKLGGEATGFAEERARRFEREEDAELARLWRDIAELARELLNGPLTAAPAAR